MWPPSWGPYFWFLRHAAGYSYLTRETPMTAEEVEQVHMFIRTCCLFLNCPSCSLHALQNIQTYPPETIQDGKTLWEYDIAFHNRVNVREGNGKSATREVTLEEVPELLLFNLQSRFPKAETLKDLDHFLFDYWMPLCLSTLRTTESTKTQYLNWMKSYLYMLPFAIQHPEHREHMLRALENVSAPATEQEAMAIVSLLWNSICESFEQPKRSAEELAVIWKQILTKEYTPEMVRAHAMRVEDHKKIKELQQQIASLGGESSLKAEQNKSAPSDSESVWVTISIVLFVLLGLCVLVMVVSVVVYRRSGHLPFGKAKVHVN